MTTKQILTTILLFIFYVTSYGQSFTKADSAQLISIWEKTYKCMLSKDTLELKALCLDTIECTLCGYRNDTIVDYIKPVNYFFSNGLIKLNDNEKLRKIISTNKPIVGETGSMVVHGNREETYGVIYTQYKPNELRKNHEGVSVVFDYVKRQNSYKLVSIATVP